MRRTALRVVSAVAAVAVGVSVAVVIAASGLVHASSDFPVTLTASDEPPVVLRPEPNGIWGYRGNLTGGVTGNYRATCVSLGESTSSLVHNPTYAGHAHSAAPDEVKITCTIVLAFGGDESPDGGSLVLVGAVKRPSATAGLFAAKSIRQVAITGGTGGPHSKYEGKQGKALLKGGGTIIIAG
jgi:hypothetical protein